MNNIKEFKSKEQKMAEEQKEAIKNNFLEQVGLREEDLYSEQGLYDKITELSNEGKAIVFGTETEALLVGSVMINYPAFDDVSHFDIIRCVSRLSIFYRLKPIRKKDNIQFVFAEDKMVATANLLQIDKL
jgi:hypothetical protein